MDSDFSEKLKSLLSDSDAMSKIMSIASGLGLSDTQSKPVQDSQSTERESTAPASEALPAVSQAFERQSDPRIALLYSLKPLLREEKRERLDALTRALALASVMKNFRK